jgi:hypothetical protein
MHASFFSTPYAGAHIDASPQRAAVLFGHRKVPAGSSCNVFSVAISVGRLNLAPIIDLDRVILSGRPYTAYSIRGSFMADPSSSLDVGATGTVCQGTSTPCAANPGLHDSA